MRLIEKNIIDKLAKKHGMTKEQASDIYSQFGKFIRDSMEECEKNEDGTFDPESFKVIHISGFGKIVPNEARIKQINKSKLKQNG